MQVIGRSLSGLSDMLSSIIPAHEFLFACFGDYLIFFVLPVPAPEILSQAKA
jgi:hypothetical protein